jgi:hypothetical protein
MPVQSKLPVGPVVVVISQGRCGVELLIRLFQLVLGPVYMEVGRPYQGGYPSKRVRK